MPTERINRYGQIDETWGESNIFGGLDSAEVIERLIVSDGQIKRGFRKNMFNENINLCAVATGPHSVHHNMIQVEYVKNLLEKGAAPTINIKVTEEGTD